MEAIEVLATFRIVAGVPVEHLQDIQRLAFERFTTESSESERELFRRVMRMCQAIALDQLREARFRAHPELRKFAVLMETTD
jgi:hypothetical protein